MFANTTGGEVYIRPFGDPASSRPIVFLHALGTDHRIWADVLCELPRAMGGIVLDLPGHGLSGIPRSGFDVTSAAKQMLEVLYQLDLTDVVLVGLSVGGQIALEMAHDAADRVSGLVLCNTGAVIGTREGWNTRIEAVEERGLEALSESIVELWVTDRSQDGSRALRALLSSTPKAGYIAMAKLVRDADLRSRLPEINAPVLCLASSEDRATPPSSLQALAAGLANAEVVEIPRTAHLPTAEAPAALAAHIGEYVANLGPQESFGRGMRIRRAVLGDDHVERASAHQDPLDSVFQRFITEGAWGSVWARSQLSLRERSLVTLALLAGTGSLDEVEMHVRASKNTGATVEDLAEVLLHVAVYAGVPAANSAIHRARAAIARLESEFEKAVTRLHQEEAS